jgi:hypothetical protein
MSTSRVGVLLRYVHRMLGDQRDAGSDDHLLDRFVRQQDEQAFAGLMGRYGPLVWGACRRLAENEQDVEDVFQATFLLLARKAATIRKGLRSAAGCSVSPTDWPCGPGPTPPAAAGMSSAPPLGPSPTRPTT